MKPKKNTLFLILAIGTLFINTASAQNPFKTLDKAKILFDKGRLDKALRKIEIAEKSKYCTCGSCVIELSEKINLLKYDIYHKLGKYELSRQYLDSTPTLNFQKMDSLKVLSYQSEYGKEFISKMIDSSLNNTQLACNDNNCYVEIPLSSVKTIRFKTILYFNDNNKIEVIEMWKKDFLKSPIYKMIKYN